MKYKIAVIAGDGIGKEITDGAITVLDAVSAKYDIDFEYNFATIGGCAIDKYGEPLPKCELDKCKNSDSVLLGAVGGPKWDNVPANIRPEKALLGLRKELELFANLRPAIVYDCLSDASPLKERVLGGGADIMVVRELTGGIYFGEHCEGNEAAHDVMEYSRNEIERIARVAFDSAMGRNKKITSVDKANVLAVSRLWRNVIEDVAKDYPEVSVDHMYVDNAAMQLALNPTQFDVIVTGNMFGDILSDLASAITGSIGMLPSASLGTSKLGMYEPVHGSAPDIAGQDIANPIATILSCAMMMRTSFDCAEGADAVESAVKKVLEAGYRTADIAKSGEDTIGCKMMSKLIAENV